MSSSCIDCNLLLRWKCAATTWCSLWTGDAFPHAYNMMFLDGLYAVSNFPFHRVEWTGHRNDFCRLYTWPWWVCYDYSSIFDGVHRMLRMPWPHGPGAHCLVCCCLGHYLPNRWSWWQHRRCFRQCHWFWYGMSFGVWVKTVLHFFHVNP